MEKIFLGLGSNVGNKRRNIDTAIQMLSNYVKDIKKSYYYLTRAVGYTEQDDFINIAISGYTELTPEALFKRIKEIEKEVGRIERFHWGPREVDIDILFYGDQIITRPELKIPHPRIQERDFVLQPLLDLDPEFIHPVLKKSVKELFEELENFSIFGCLK